MNSVRVFDPALCCSSGVCGPSVDPQLARFAADLDWLKAQGVAVERFNLAQQPAAFAEDPSVRSALETKGEAGLPLVKVNGEIKSSGVYPSRAELAGWAGVGTPAPSVFTEAVAEPRRDVSERASTPIMRKTSSSSCCAPATRQPGKEGAGTKNGGCC